MVTTSPWNVDKLDNGFRLHGGGGVYLAESSADIGSDPFMYWQTNLADQVWSYDIDGKSSLHFTRHKSFWDVFFLQI